MRLPGHTLVAQGAAFWTDWHGRAYRATDRRGRGLCSCGALGPVEDSDAARKRWYTEHKDEIAGGAL